MATESVTPPKANNAAESPPTNRHVQTPTGDHRVYDNSGTVSDPELLALSVFCATYKPEGPFVPDCHTLPEYTKKAKNLQTKKRKRKGGVRTGAKKKMRTFDCKLQKNTKGPFYTSIRLNKWEKNGKRKLTLRGYWTGINFAKAFSLVGDELISKSELDGMLNVFRWLKLNVSNKK